MNELTNEAQRLIIDWAQEKITDTENDYLSFKSDDLESIEWGELTIYIDLAYLSRMKVYNQNTSALGIVGYIVHLIIDCTYHVENEDGKTVIEEQTFTKRLAF